MATKKNDAVGKKIIISPKEKENIGIDISGNPTKNVIHAVEVGQFNMGSINALSFSAQTREQIYDLIDQMSQDDMISSITETYTEDATQEGATGQVIWCESDNPVIAKYINKLLFSLNVDKHLYEWTYSLLNYGDLYLRLFRKSDVKDLNFKMEASDKETLNESKKKKMNEDINLVVYGKNDHYIPYIEAVPNPGEMFELTQFGRTQMYVQAPTRVVTTPQDQLYNYTINYKINQKNKDVRIYDAKSFVHACLDNTSTRQPETVDLFMSDVVDATKDNTTTADISTTSYKVRRGQSIHYNSFRVWRELNLLENSALLNRLTRSSVVRIVEIDSPDVSPKKARESTRYIKELMEQKTSLNAGSSFAEYTNPGPIINTIYNTVHDGKGKISIQNIGGDFDPKQLVDIEFWRDKLYGSYKVPKQFFGWTGDNAGFSAGTSLTIYSSRYGKSIKRIQKIITQAITDVVNLFIVDRNLGYINKFKIRMQAPITQEELDKVKNDSDKVRLVGDLMGQLAEIKDDIIKFKMLKILLSSTANSNPEVIALLDKYISDEENKIKEEGKSSSEEAPAEEAEEAPEEDLDANKPTFESLEKKGGKLPSFKDLNIDGTDGE